MKWFVYTVLLFNATGAFSKDIDLEKFGLENKTGQYISDSIYLLGTDSNIVKLTDIINKPTILSLVYFDCDQYCPKIMSGTKKLINDLNLNPGKEYQVLTIGFNEKDKLSDVKKISQLYKDSLQLAHQNPEGWKFYMADKKNIKRLTNSIGYHYYNKDGHYIHFAFLVVVSGNGKIINYMYGYKFLPVDFLITYQYVINNKERSTVPRDLVYCTNFNAPADNKLHRLAVISGIFIILSALSLFMYLVLKRKKINER